MRYKEVRPRGSGDRAPLRDKTTGGNSMKKALLCGLALAFASAWALASDDSPIMVETDAAAILAQQQQIREDVSRNSARYSGLDPSARSQLQADQDVVFRLLEGRERSTELSPSDQSELFNRLESISAIINRAEDERMVCERTRPIGSNRPVNVCKTVAQRRAERESALRDRGNRDTRCQDCGPFTR